MIALISCNETEEEDTATTVDENYLTESAVDESGNNLSSDSEEGIKELERLVDSKYGWRSFEEYDGKHIYMVFTKDQDNNYHAEWNNEKFEVSNDFFMEFYTEEDLKSDDFIMGECYSLVFLSKDTFKICCVHMCAVIKNEYWDIYVRNDNSEEDNELISLNQSTNPEDIEKFFNKIKGKYIECIIEKTNFTQVCLPFNFTKKPKERDNKHQMFWVDQLQDGYNFFVQSVTYDITDPNTIIFDGTDNLYKREVFSIKFTILNSYKVAVLNNGSDETYFIHEDDYDKINEPAEPCDDYEEGY